MKLYHPAPNSQVRQARWLVALLGCGLTCLALAGCITTRPADYVKQGFKVGPNFQQPAAYVAPAWLNENNPQLKSSPADLARWWQVFNDDKLNWLIDSAYRQNLDLRQAAQRVAAARAQLGIAVGSYFPQQQTLQGGYNRNQVSTNAANQAFLPNRFFDNYFFGPSVSWELDFWGRYRRSIESARGEYNSSIENYDDVLVILFADVAATYTQLRTLQYQIALAEKNVKIQQGSLKLTEAQKKGGLVTQLDVAQAIANVAQTESLIPPLEAQVRQASDRLCVLLGMPPQDLVPVLGKGPIPKAPPEVALGIPADLLRRRPDVRRALFQVAAQSARIGVAEADLYPSFFLNGNINVQSERFVNLFESASVNASFGPSFQWNILNYGRILNNVRLQDARFQQLAYNYQSSVLKANQEVEDAAIGFLKAQEQAKKLLESTTAADQSVKLAEIQYKGGDVNYTQVFTLQTFLTTQEQQLAQSQGSIALNLITLYKALGGGWESRIGGNAPQGLVVPEVVTPVQPEETPLPKKKLLKNKADPATGPRLASQIPTQIPNAKGGDSSKTKLVQGTTTGPLLPPSLPPATLPPNLLRPPTLQGIVPVEPGPSLELPLLPANNSSPK